MAQEVTEKKKDQITAITETYMHFRTGPILAQDLRKVLLALGYALSDSHLKYMIDQYAKDGYVSLANCIELIEHLPDRSKTVAHHWGRFRSIDRDGSGYITAKELQDNGALQGWSISEAEGAKMVDRLSLNDDHKVDFAEFYFKMTGNVFGPDQ